MLRLSAGNANVKRRSNHGRLKVPSPLYCGASLENARRGPCRILLLSLAGWIEVCVKLKDLKLLDDRIVFRS